MLNISPNRVEGKVQRNKYNSFRVVLQRSGRRTFLRLVALFFIILFFSMFLPWTQNIRARGNLTSLRPDQRPQAVQSIIGGRVEKWFVQEGDFVQKGDTLLYISEIKAEYLNPELVDLTGQQIENKKFAARSYEDKAGALAGQLDALEAQRILRLEQAQNKVAQARFKVLSDSADLEAATIQFNIADEQFKRADSLYADGLKSLTELENRRAKRQQARAKMVSLENQLLTSRNEKANAIINLSTIETEFNEKIAKTSSDRFTALSDYYDTKTAINKLENDYSNYMIRSGMYFIPAPQDGYITRAVTTGLGETIKEGADIVTIMPADNKLAVELYIRPIDLPLINREQKVRLLFDGWPAIVFSGWPNASYGTYGGKVVAVDNFISTNGKYRILVAEDPDDIPWPEQIRVGAGAQAFALLNIVPVWYEIWRQINGFPPDYYTVPPATVSDQ